MINTIYVYIISIIILPACMHAPHGMQVVRMTNRHKQRTLSLEKFLGHAVKKLRSHIQASQIV